VSTQRGILVADGTSTVVNFDYNAGKSVPVPDELRQAIDAVESSARSQ
jgi:acyl-CoA thioesterase FadM